MPADSCVVLDDIRWQLSTLLTLGYSDLSQFRPLLHSEANSPFYISKTGPNSSQNHPHVAGFGPLQVYVAS